MRRRCPEVVVVLAALLLTPAWGRADPATAEALFREGRRLLDEGQYAQACAKLAESHAQDPASGTLINLALCYEKQGKLATAWAHYRLAVSLATRDLKPERATAAEAKISELEARLPRLTIRADQRARDMAVVWGDLRLNPAAFDSPIPVDPGEHPLMVSAPGFQSWSTVVAMKEGEFRVVELPALSPLPGIEEHQPPAAVQASPAPAQAARAGTPSDARTDRASAAPSSAALLVGGSGLLLLGVGAFFGASALSNNAQAEELCPSLHGCSSQALDARDTAEQQAWIANVTIGVGAIATAAGIYLWLTPPHQPPIGVSIAASQRSAGLSLDTRW